MQDLLQSAFDPEAFRRQGHALVDTLAGYLAGAQTGRRETVTDYRHPDEELAYWQADFSRPPAGDPLPLLEDVLERSIHLHHPRYMGHQVAPPLPLAALTGMLTSLLNNGMALYEMGQVSTALERVVTDWLARKLGFPAAASGFLTSGGTLATLTALLAARAAKAPGDVWERGTSDRLAVLVSEQAHYCVDRAVRIMGLGEEGVVKIPVDDRFGMRTDLLAEAYAAARARGLTPFAVVGSACSTATGSYDDLAAVADFCAGHGLWFHADGAHGAAVVVSEAYKGLVRGIERADSVVVDFHKMLLAPALVTAVVFRSGEDGFRTFQQKAQYLWKDQQSPEWFNLGKRTFECTKVMMSVKVYATLRTYGEALFAANVDALYGLARRLGEMIGERPDFELATAPQANIVCFRYVGRGGGGERENETNGRIRQELLREGRFYLVQTTLRGKLYLRVTLMNPFTTEAHLAEMLAAVTALANRLHPAGTAG
ncbi:MAG: L-2,4-diaminobutyrate decarboxylase [uncultured Cytophagales bacterium]|uniref:L-2,4-diaminobutyrate decarboxylase n=1 Tax=uncultured Cytophagales bacterium TaxID=158755 RepID=A0A6J4JPG7_9SPHI|nr:MAG: L-2,4-diaminobutyrate decarboxylase [uncultured Cytophagales bacterium]